MRTHLAALSFASISVFAAGCATAPAQPAVPAALQPPAGSTLLVEALASGVQIYECSRKPDSTYEWAFKAPEATLADRAGRSIGKHYAGPTWEANDGSKVAGEARARDAGPTPTAVPWLLLAAKSHAGTGTFTAVTFVQRIATVGGIAPTAGCSAANLASQARVPYTATYVFYR